MDAFQQLNLLATKIESFVEQLGTIIFVISVVIAGMMRALSFGNERRITLSNQALACAIVGYIIMLLAGSLAALLRGIFTTPLPK